MFGISIIFSTCVFLMTLLSEVQPARILGVFPVPSLSHQVVFRAYTKELAKRGHELVIITPNPAWPKDRPPDNVTEIDVGFSYEFIGEKLDQLTIFKRGVIADVDAITKELYEGFLHLIQKQIEYPEVKKIIEDKDQYFDLVVTEAFFSMPLVFGKLFNAPVIQFSSFHGLPENYETVGALGSHPIYYPNFNRNKFSNLSFFDKIKEIYYELKLSYEFWKIVQVENELLKKLFGPDAPNINELKENVGMLFVNSHPIFADNRPVPPSVVYLGAFHLQPVKEIPQDLNSYLNASTRGVVYVSLGSNVLPSRMDKALLNVFLDAFEKLPYDILWKFEGDGLERIPKNVKIQKWFPQRDLLFHQNLKVFVTQGGLQSTDEAIDAAVPMVGIPMIADQWYNVNKYVELGIGVQLDSMTITADQLVRAVKTVFENKSYRENIQRLRSIILDQPQSPLERAVWWTEHVLRHGGARHLRAPAANMPWTEYLMLDFVIPVMLLLVVVSVLCCRVVLVVVCRSKRKDKRD